MYLPRFTKNGTDLAERISGAERDAGKRANYHVYYRANGKLQFDPSWSDTPQEARKSTMSLAAEVAPRDQLEFVGLVSLVPNAKL